MHAAQITPLRSIHQIELTSRCNLTCTYCINSTMLRNRQDISRETFERALVWAGHFARAETQGPTLNLAGVGESTLHPQFIEMVQRASKFLWDYAQKRQRSTHEKFLNAPNTCSTFNCLTPNRVVLATNGTVLTRQIAEQLATAAPPGAPKPSIWVSLHPPSRPNSAGHETLRALDLLSGITMDPSLYPNDWAGQVRWRTTQGVGPEGRLIACPWLHDGQGFVASDGRILTCCLDGTGESQVGHVNDAPATLKMRPWRLCRTCYQWLPK